jgi:hypothetical protein
MLRWWKRKVLRSYVAWMKRKYSLPSRNAQVEETVKVNLAVDGKEWHLGGKNEYQWEQDEQSLYWKWWKDRLVTTVEDMIPASDAIARAARTS